MLLLAGLVRELPLHGDNREAMKGLCLIGCLLGLCDIPGKTPDAQTYEPLRCQTANPIRRQPGRPGKIDANIEVRVSSKNIIVDPSDGRILYKPEALAREK
jgi:hypothetical protein